MLEASRNEGTGGHIGNFDSDGLGSLKGSSKRQIEGNIGNFIPRRHSSESKEFLLSVNNNRSSLSREIRKVSLLGAPNRI